MRTLLKKTLWLLPFGCFIAGYWLPYLFFSVSITTVPNLLGKNAHTALQRAAEHNLSIKLLRTQEDATLPAGTVLFQTPHAGRSIRPHQTILLVTSCQPAQHTAPDCVGLTQEAAQNLLKIQGMSSMVHYVPSEKPSGTVIAQEPLAGTALENTKLTLYTSTASPEQVLVPSCTDLTVQDAYEFLLLHNLKLEAQHACNQDTAHCRCIITEQKPLPGSFLDLKKPCVISVKAKR